VDSTGENRAGRGGIKGQLKPIVCERLVTRAKRGCVCGGER
jgi:hypothetical protein